MLHHVRMPIHPSLMNRARVGQTALPPLNLDTPITSIDQNLLYQTRLNQTGNAALHVTTVDGNWQNADAQAATRYIQSVIRAPITGTLTARVMNALTSGQFSAKTNIGNPVLVSPAPPASPSPSPSPTFASLPFLPLIQQGDIAVVPTVGLFNGFLPAHVTPDPKTFIVFTMNRGSLTPDGRHASGYATAVIANGVLSPLPTQPQGAYLSSNYIASISRGPTVLWQNPTSYVGDAIAATATANHSTATIATATSTPAGAIDSEKAGPTAATAPTTALAPATTSTTRTTAPNLPVVPILIGVGVVGAAIYLLTRPS